MKIALTGASGFLGCTIARQFAEEGDEVRGLLRPTSRRDHVEHLLSDVVQGSMNDVQACHSLLADSDVLVHNAVDWRMLREGDHQGHLQTNLVRPIELLREAGSRGMKIVFVSSVAVHHDMLEQWNGLIDASHPTRPAGLYGAAKASIESHLWALHAMSNTSFAIIRPAAIYGIDPSIERSIGHPILRDVAAGKPYTRAGGGKFVHVDDVAQSIVRSAKQNTTDGQVYHLADCYARWSDWAHLCCEITGVTVEIDDSSPTAPHNMFDTSALEQNLEISLTRGIAGIKTYLQELHQAMQA